MPSYRRIASLLALGGLCAAVLTGCASARPGPDSGSGAEHTARLKLSPVGDAGHWFADGFANGAKLTYATTGTICGFTDALSIEQVDGPVADQRVQARRFADGAIIWEAPHAGCSEGAVTDGAVTLGPGSSLKGRWRQVDANTGKQIRDLPLDKRMSSARVFETLDDLLIMQPDSDHLLALSLDDGSEKWSYDAGSNAEFTPLDDGFIGIASGLDKTIEVLDARTGESRLAKSGIDKSKFTWASDGYVLNINESDPEYAFFDLDGEELTRTTDRSQYNFVPAPRDGVTFPIKDHLAAGRVVGVARDGTPALFQDGRQADHTPEGEITDLPDSIISLRGVSADGRLLLFDGPRDSGGGIVVIDARGDEVFRYAAQDAHVRIEAGMILLQQDAVTQILTPAL